MTWHVIQSSINNYEKSSPLHMWQKLTRLVNRLTTSRFLRGTIRQNDGHNPTTPANKKDVSSRLQSHALLHRLVRRNLPYQASTLAKEMMLSGVPVRCKTLEAIFSCIKEDSDHNFNGGRPYIGPTELLDRGEVILLRCTMSDRGTKIAIDLLMTARLSKQRRSKNMFNILILHCIANGEIIVASLLYEVMMKDWQDRELTGDLVPKNGNYPNHPKTPFPGYEHLELICNSVMHALASKRSDVDSQFAFRASLQALAILATMLHHQTIAHGRINLLLTALHKCPQVPDLVWVHDHTGYRQRFVAYRYFHGILLHFIHSLPTHPPVQDERKKILPPIDDYSYACLLMYALCHLNSFVVAETILHHMIHERYRPLMPDTLALNVIAQSGVRLHNYEIANVALSKLKGIWGSVIPVHSTSLTQSTLPSLLDIPERKEDICTLSTRIAYLTATGQTQVIVDLLPTVFPTIFPSENQQFNVHEWDDFATRHEQDLYQSTLLGSAVHISLLNSMRVAGRTVLAEKVWKMAKTAEKMSWSVGIKGQLKPWCLPAAAYTAMIKVYAEEVRKAHMNGKLEDHRLSISTQKPVPFCQYIFSRLLSSRRGFHERINGRSILEGDFPETGSPRTRSTMGRYLGMHIYRLLKTTRLQVSRVADKNKLVNKEMHPPKPDLRFFTAILDVVGRYPYAPSRKERRVLGLYSRYRQRSLGNVRRGNQVVNPNLLEIGKDMVAAGFEIPLPFQKFFVGVPEVFGSLGQSKPRLERDREVFTREQVGKLKPSLERDQRVFTREQVGKLTPSMERDRRVFTREQVGKLTPSLERDQRVFTREQVGKLTPSMERDQRVSTRERVGKLTPSLERDQRVSTREQVGKLKPSLERDQRVFTREQVGKLKPSMERDQRVFTREQVGKLKPSMERDRRVFTREQVGKLTPSLERDQRVSTREQVGKLTPSMERDQRVFTRERVGKLTPSLERDQRVSTREQVGKLTPSLERDQRVFTREQAGKLTPSMERDQRVFTRERVGKLTPSLEKDRRVFTREQVGKLKPSLERNRRVFTAKETWNTRVQSRQGR